MRVMITGAAGFIGGFLARFCSEAGAVVLGLDVSAPGHLGSGSAFEFCDIRDSVRLDALLRTFRPDRIFHLAAQSYPTVSLAKPRETLDINAGGTVNLFECLRAVGIMPTVVVACSSAEYGPVAESDLPVREDHALHPLHPYGVSKVAQDLLAAQYFANWSIPTVRIRIFNTTGPGKIGDVCSDLTRRMTEIELGLRSRRLPVGNLDRRRAILDVRDLVRALWLSAECCEIGDVYNVSGAHTYSVEDIIGVLRARTHVEFDVEQDPLLTRDCDEPVIAGNVTKFQRRTGWTQQLDLMTTLSEMLDWWRNRLTSDPEPDSVHLRCDALDSTGGRLDAGR